MIILTPNPQRTLKRYQEHIMKNEIFTQFPEVQERMMNLPICPKCERPALRDTRREDPIRGYCTCPECGYHGPQSHTVQYHLEEHVLPKKL